MPKKNNNKRRTQKKGGAQLVGFSSPKNLFPMTMMGTGTYGVTITYAVPSTMLGTHTFRLNSIFDPDYSSVTGRSIGGFAQASVLYGKYRVFDAEVMFDGNLGNNVVRGFYYCVVSNETNIGIDPGVWAAQRSVWVAPIKGGDGVSHRMRVPIHTVFGVPATAVVTEDNFSSVMVGSPLNTVFLHVGMHNMSGSTADFTFTVRINLRVRLEQPTALA